MIVAIDGPAGAGKSTAARALAERLGFAYLDTGAMYRALTWLALERGAGTGDGAALAGLARDEPVSFAGGRVEIAGVDVTEAIREPRIDAAVSDVARHAGVRAVMRERQRALAASGDSVVEGRDIGTAVCPGAEVKAYLVADPAERTRRRGAERDGGGPVQVVERDERDAAQMGRAPDAHVIDTTSLTVDEVVDRLAALVGARAAR